MGKPKARVLKLKHKARQNAEEIQNKKNVDELMEDESSQVEQTLKENTISPVVLEDIKIAAQKGKITKKKDKRKQKKEKLLARLRSSKEVDLQAKQMKERSKAVIVGDMKPLMDALPEMSNIIESYSFEAKKESTTIKEKKKNWNDKKWKTRRKEELKDIDLFKKVLLLPEYKQDPVCAITSHVEYMVKGDLI